MEAYEWVKGARVKSDPDAVGHLFADLRARNGDKLDPEHVIEAARSPRAPHHVEFEWDDKKAAHRDRLHTALYLMRHIKEVLVTVTGKKRSVRAYYPVVKNDERAYRATRNIMADEDMRQQVVENALNDHLHWERRYEEVRAFAEEVAMLIEAGEKARTMRARKERTNGRRASQSRSEMQPAAV